MGRQRRHAEKIGIHTYIIAETAQKNNARRENKETGGHLYGYVRKERSW